MMGDNRDDSPTAVTTLAEGGIGLVPVETVGPGARPLLVDRRQRVLRQAVDLVHSRCG